MQYLTGDFIDGKGQHFTDPIVGYVSGLIQHRVGTQFLAIDGYGCTRSRIFNGSHNRHHRFYQFLGVGGTEKTPSAVDRRMKEIVDFLRITGFGVRPGWYRCGGIDKTGVIGIAGDIRLAVAIHIRQIDRSGYAKRQRVGGHVLMIGRIATLGRHHIVK